MYISTKKQKRLKSIQKYKIFNFNVTFTGLIELIHCRNNTTDIVQSITGIECIVSVGLGLVTAGLLHSSYVMTATAMGFNPKLPNSLIKHK